MDEIKSSENKIKKYNTKGSNTKLSNNTKLSKNNTKLSNKFGTGINDKKSFDNVISDLNLDLMKINKKLANRISREYSIIIRRGNEIKTRCRKKDIFNE